MIKAKLLAMCVCPALGAPPAILAVSPPARHVVVHALQHAARRLDHHVPSLGPAPGTALAAAAPPCAPAIALSDMARPPRSSVDPALGNAGDRTAAVDTRTADSTTPTPTASTATADRSPVAAGLAPVG